MHCVICGVEARHLSSMGDQDRLSCPACGEYRIAHSARKMLAQNGHRFDVDVARIWLTGRRCTGQVPLIDWTLVSVLASPAR